MIYGACRGLVGSDAFVLVFRLQLLFIRSGWVMSSIMEIGCVLQHWKMRIVGLTLECAAATSNDVHVGGQVIGCDSEFYSVSPAAPDAYLDH